MGQGVYYSMKGSGGSPGIKKKKKKTPNCHSPNAVSHIRTWRASTCRGDHRECYSEVGGWVGGGNIFICGEKKKKSTTMW